jgi:hypothetical protein
MQPVDDKRQTLLPSNLSLILKQAVASSPDLMRSQDVLPNGRMDKRTAKPSLVRPAASTPQGFCTEIVEVHHSTPCIKCGLGLGMFSHI